MKQSFTADQKASIVLEALSGTHTLSELGSRHAVHPNRIGVWKKQAVDILRSGFSDTHHHETARLSAEISELHRIIGKRDSEFEWLKKKLEPFNRL